MCRRFYARPVVRGGPSAQLPAVKEILSIALEAGLHNMRQLCVLEAFSGRGGPENNTFIFLNALSLYNVLMASFLLQSSLSPIALFHTGS